MFICYGHVATLIVLKSMWRNWIVVTLKYEFEVGSKTKLLLHYTGWICRGGCRVDTAEVASGMCGCPFHSFPLVIELCLSIHVEQK